MSLCCFTSQTWIRLESQPTKSGLGQTCCGPLCVSACLHSCWCPGMVAQFRTHFSFFLFFFQFLIVYFYCIFLFKFLKIYLLIMLLQLSHFPPSLHPAYPIPPTFPPYSSCPWVILISSLASTFPKLFLPSPCLFSTYHLCYLFSVPSPPLPLPLPY